MTCMIDIHIIIIIIIIILAGAFGGWLNYLHHFDINIEDSEEKKMKVKYVCLGIGSAILVPAFLKMIASDLIKPTEQYDNVNYLIFSGFCLVAAIFSRRFINSIGEKILEAAQKAEITSNENKKEIESTRHELSTTQDRIEDVKVSVILKNQEYNEVAESETSMQRLLALVDSYIERTTISDYTERLRTKAEIGRQMGQLIVGNNLSKFDLLKNYSKEGMYLALAYSVDLKPDHDGVALLNRIAKVTTQLYTKYVILIAYRTLCSTNFVTKFQAKEIAEIAHSFRNGADNSLKRHIEDTLNVLRFIDTEIV